MKLYSRLVDVYYSYEHHSLWMLWTSSLFYQSLNIMGFNRFDWNVINTNNLQKFAVNFTELRCMDYIVENYRWSIPITLQLTITMCFKPLLLMLKYRLMRLSCTLYDGKANCFHTCNPPGEFQTKTKILSDLIIF